MLFSAFFLVLFLCLSFAILTRSPASAGIVNRPLVFLKIVISPYLSEKSSDFDDILYTAADFELDERQLALVPNEKVALDRLQVRQNVFLVLIYISALDLPLLLC